MDYFQAGSLKETFEARSANFSQLFNAATKIETIDIIHVSGNPVISIGTTPGGTELMAEDNLATGHYNLFVNLSWPAAFTIYFNIAGGEANFIVTSKNL